MWGGCLLTVRPPRGATPGRPPSARASTASASAIEAMVGAGGRGRRCRRHALDEVLTRHRLGEVRPGRWGWQGLGAGAGAGAGAALAVIDGRATGPGATTASASSRPSARSSAASTHAAWPAWAMCAISTGLPQVLAVQERPSRRTASRVAAQQLGAFRIRETIAALPVHFEQPRQNALLRVRIGLPEERVHAEAELVGHVDVIGALPELARHLLRHGGLEAVQVLDLLVHLARAGVARALHRADPLRVPLPRVQLRGQPRARVHGVGLAGAAQVVQPEARRLPAHRPRGGRQPAGVLVGCRRCPARRTACWCARTAPPRSRPDGSPARPARWRPSPRPE